MLCVHKHSLPSVPSVAAAAGAARASRFLEYYNLRMEGERDANTDTEQDIMTDFMVTDPAKYDVQTGITRCTPPPAPSHSSAFVIFLGTLCPVRTSYVHSPYPYLYLGWTGMSLTRSIDV